MARSPSLWDSSSARLLPKGRKKEGLGWLRKIVSFSAPEKVRLIHLVKRQQDLVNPAATLLKRRKKAKNNSFSCVMCEKNSNFAASNPGKLCLENIILVSMR